MRNPFLFPKALVLFFALLLAPNAFAQGGDQTVTLALTQEGFVSPMILREETFNSMAVTADRAVKGLMVNFEPDKAQSEWQEVAVDHNDGWNESQVQALVLTKPTKSLQFKWAAPEKGVQKLELKLDFSYEKANQAVTLSPRGTDLFAGTVTSLAPTIISREAWGADESLRYWKEPESDESTSEDNSEKPVYDPCAAMEKQYASEVGIVSTTTHMDGKPLTWAVQIMKYVKGLALHHTDSEIRDVDGNGVINKQDYLAIVRAIYRFHTVSRGWGDIGYNYLIDPLGNIYLGRAGGEKAVAAHSLCFNNGAIGIAMIGNYQDEPISPMAQDSLEWLLATLGKRYNLDLDGEITMRGKTLPTVFPHKAVRATSCPGEQLNNALPQIRKNAAALAPAASVAVKTVTKASYNASFIGKNEVISLMPGETKTLTLAFKNEGQNAWEKSAAQSTWLHVTGNKIKTFPGLKVLGPDSQKIFVGADLVEKKVASGQKGTFMLTVSAGAKAEKKSFDLTVVTGKYKLGESKTILTVQVAEPKLSYSIVQANLPKGKVFQGQSLEGEVILKNTGNAVWNQSTTFLKASSPRFRKSLFAADLTSSNILGRMVEAAVKPGEAGRFQLNLRAPMDKMGILKENFALAVENNWLEESSSMSFEVQVEKPTYKIQMSGKETNLAMQPGEKRSVEVTLKNIGNAPLQPADFGIALSGMGMTVFKPLIKLDKPLFPNAETTLSFIAQAPSPAGNYRLILRGTVNKKIMAGGILNYPVTVSGSAVSSSPALPTSAIEKENLFRVRLGYESDSAEMTASTSFKVMNGSGQTLFSVPMSGVVSTQKISTGISATYAGQTKTDSIVRFVPAEGGIMEIKSWSRKPSWDSTGKLNDNKFRGAVELRLVDGKLAYINELPLEDYLKGLGEVSNSDPTEKKKVIIVAARSYAYHYSKGEAVKFPGKPYHCTDNPNECQKYLGYGYELRSPDYVDAVEKTSGEMVKYAGKVIKVPYFSKSDGIKTKSAQEVWGWTNTPYLQSVDDPWCKGETPAGHQVGISGCGATGQANEGKNYIEIIKYYLKGVEVGEA